MIIHGELGKTTDAETKLREARIAKQDEQEERKPHVVFIQRCESEWL